MPLVYVSLPAPSLAAISVVRAASPSVPASAAPRPQWLRLDPRIPLSTATVGRQPYSVLRQGPRLGAFTPPCAAASRGQPCAALLWWLCTLFSWHAQSQSDVILGLESVRRT
ncbi:hypothetical protein NDU88_001976 [Pleurodeles waltl]|uniref:Secreted protein n=1 Tax=Pleurodeles waltl TaxID=8319 RepID=A0AAV7NGB4_PLEWA|nr:hypothetical protein NDU88_001976 [Pleurodeles waltl]